MGGGGGGGTEEQPVERLFFSADIIHNDILNIRGGHRRSSWIGPGDIHGAQRVIQGPRPHRT